MFILCSHLASLELSPPRSVVQHSISHMRRKETGEKKCVTISHHKGARTCLLFAIHFFLKKNISLQFRDSSHVPNI